MYRKTAVFNGIQKHMKPLREYPNGKTFSHLQNDIFCHFDFCHNRRNDLPDCLVKKQEMKKVDPFKRIAVHTALQPTHTVFSLLPEN